MILYQLTFKSLPRFEKHFTSQDALFQYLDTASQSAGKPQIKVREIADKSLKFAAQEKLA